MYVCNRIILKPAVRGKDGISVNLIAGWSMARCRSSRKTKLDLQVFTLIFAAF